MLMTLLEAFALCALIVAVYSAIIQTLKLRK